MNEPLPIGYFQFDNLIKSRVPFLLIRPAIDIESAYGVMEKMHLRNYSLMMEQMDYVQAEALVLERHARKEDPIVVICENGKSSKALAQEFVDHGYLNVYYVLDGWAGIQAEMRAERT